MYQFHDGADIKNPYYYIMNCRRCVWSSAFIDKETGREVKCCDYFKELTPFDSLDACPAGGPVSETKYREALFGKKKTKLSTK